jgi:hypothetical protein
MLKFYLLSLATLPSSEQGISSHSQQENFLTIEAFNIEKRIQLLEQQIDYYYQIFQEYQNFV